MALEIIAESPPVPPQASTNFFDDDGRPKRTGTVWTTTTQIIAAVIGSGVLSLAWATAQLGWIAGPVVLFFFSFVISYYSSCILAACYRCDETGKRSYSYMEAMQNIIGGFPVKLSRFIQYLNLVGLAIGYTVLASAAMVEIRKSICFHKNGLHSPCRVSGTKCVLVFGIVQVFLSQLPDDHKISCLSIMSAVMSFTFSGLGLGLAVSKVFENGKIEGNLTGIGMVTRTQKFWRISQALVSIAFTYSYTFVLIEIQDKIKSSPAERKTMKRATLISVATTTVFYMLFGCFGYAAFGDIAPRNLLTGFAFHNRYWLVVDIANGAVLFHLIGVYQVYCQPLFTFVESTAVRYFPGSKFVNNNIEVPISFGLFKSYKINMFKAVWRSSFVCLTTIVSILMPFFDDVVAVGILGVFGFYPLTIYFPVKMYIAQNKILKWSGRWILLQLLSITCLVISLFAAAGSFAGVVYDLKDYKPFKTMY